MPYRDEHGHFISEEEARRSGLIPDQANIPNQIPEDEVEGQVQPQFGANQRAGAPIYVDIGRGQTAEVQAGDPFVPTLDRLAEEAHYGGYFRVFLNGSEVVDPADAPATIEPGMRLAITSYDKVG